ncbi:PepSY domain-containing protein [Halotalea alkalilenta]|uniref:PepSY domain-containing protein n=1 Tax=Halotalea alkalilenta TaxID=376489 RepID=UPI000693A25B|nr:PepSY domain-containing protein [Halotalea alkalilenta]
MSRVLRAGALALALSLSGAAYADDWQPLHEAVREGRVVPLSELLDWLDRHYVGRVIEVELDREDGRLVYEIEMLGELNQRVEFEFDAESGRLIGIEGVDIEAMRRR